MKASQEDIGNASACALGMHHYKSLLSIPVLQDLRAIRGNDAYLRPCTKPCKPAVSLRGMACTESQAKNFEARRCVQQYHSHRSVHQYESHRLSRSPLSFLLVQTLSARLQQVTPVKGYTVYRPVYAKAQASTVISINKRGFFRKIVQKGVLTRHAPCHALLLQHHDVNSPRATIQRLSEVASRFRPACLLGQLLGSMFPNGAFEI